MKIQNEQIGGQYGYMVFLKKRLSGKPAAMPGGWQQIPALVEKNYKKILRGLRRRRNWLMRHGQWPVITLKPRSEGLTRMVTR